MDSQLTSRLAAVAMAVAVLAVGVAACGGSDDDNGDRAAPADKQARGSGAGDGDSADRDGGDRDGKEDRGGARNGSGGDGARGGSPPNGGSSGADADVELSGDEKQARRAAGVADGVYDAIRAMERTGGDELVADGGGEICDLMTAEARKQTIEYARRSSGRRAAWDCELAVGLLIARSQRIGGFKRTLKASIVGVNAVGDRATATIRFGKGRLTSVPLVKEDGEWKLGTSLTTAGGQQ